MEMNLNPEAEQFIRVMDNFPCMFTVSRIKKPSQNRLELQLRIQEQRVREEQEECEKALQLNVLCWIYFQLGVTKMAKEKNDESLIISPRNLLSLGNQAFMEWCACSDNSNCLQQLEKMMSEPMFENDKLNAKAGQAYLLLRLGGEYNLSLGLQLYTEVTKKQPRNYIWKYFQGIVYRCLNVIHRDLNARTADAIFQDIADNTKYPRLKSLALSEMAILFASRESASITHIEERIEKALYFTRDYATVHKNCGIALKTKGDLRAISHFETAISLKPTTVSHYLLGKCYRDSKMTRTLERDECDRKAIYHFKESYELSMKTNIPPIYFESEICQQSVWSYVKF